ncbi:hypothetical protein F0562_016212 [Nyssa sinensis]|uniref:RRM domain-containing protein n=1 Tax=Nyssa sinensis TaxID=561372 RepID=A0A5J4ZMJ1_9ASTE|nr:hypothetical protein F0562_016212 [Nyssa sinensis]
MGKKRKAASRKVVVEEKKPKVVEHDTSEEEEESEEEVEEIEEEEEEAEEAEEEESEEEEEEEEEEDEDSKRETLRKLLEPFGKDQIIEFLKEAAFKDHSIISRINQLAESDPIHRKIFVHGLGWDATTEQVLSVFKQFAEIEECKVVADKVTGRAKGYGFVLFKTRDGAQKALKERQKKIGNRMTSCQLASAGPVPNHPVPDSTGRKIYVANVGPQVNTDKLRSFFAKFGEIEEGPLGHDPVTGKPKGFAIFVYKTAEGCKKALEEPTKMFEGCQLQCRRAVEGFRTNKNQTGALGASGAAAIQQTDINTLNYGVGVNPGILSHNVNPAAVLVGQSPGIGLVNPMLASAFNQTALASPSIEATHSLGFSGNYGINTISPNMIDNYGSKAALQGLGAYQSAQLGYSSAGATAAAPIRSQSGFGFMGTNFPSYFGR